MSTKSKLRMFISLPCVILALVAGFVVSCEKDDTIDKITGSSSNSNKSADEVDFKSLNWCWGGVRASGATLNENSQISGLKVNGSSGMSYSWVKGGCEALGASSSTDCNHTLACLFVKTSGGWKGGKFDWISTSRRSRDFANPNSGYNGWDKSATSTGKEFAFVIISSNGKQRTNVIYFKR